MDGFRTSVMTVTKLVALVDDIWDSFKAHKKFKNF